MITRCEEIPDIPILKFLESLGIQRGYLFENFDCEQSVLRAMPQGVSYELAIEKMQTLIDRGLVHGCTCGCRGDFWITDNGLKFLDEMEGGADR